MDSETTSPVTVQTLTDREDAWLCRFATRASESQGRRVPENEADFDSQGHDFRTCFQRDKDRIIHSTAFRRLVYKTQVFVNHEGDHYRTRLTHSIEVSQVARSIARTLRLNEDLAEVTALAHDLGHTPFGHAGERALNQLMESHGGFEHNAQALRIVDVLEERYPDIPGLNLTAEVRRGLLKSKRPYPGEGEGLAPTLSVEAGIADLSDEIAYNSHDCDDGLASGLLSLDHLRQAEIWRSVEEDVRASYPRIDEKKLRYATVRALIDRQVQDLILETLARMRALENEEKEESDLRAALTPCFSEKMKKQNLELKSVLRAELYSHPQVVSAMDKSVAVMERLFTVYTQQPERLPGAYRNRVEQIGRERTVCDYIAGMTDRYAEQVARNL